MSENAITLYEHDPATPKVAAFLREQSRAAGFGVYHIRNAKLGNQLRTVPGIIEGEKIAEWSSETAAQIVRQAHDDAAALGGKKQNYAVVSEAPNGKPLGRVVFRIENDLEIEDDDEEGTERSVTAMLAKLTDGLVRSSVHSVGRQQESLLKTLDRLEGENKRLHETIAAERATEYQRRIEIFKLLEDLQNMSVERETARELGKIKARMMERSGDAMSKLIPHAINHMTGKQIIKTEDTAIQEMARGIVDGIGSEDAFNRIMGTMPPHVGALFAALLKRAGGFEVEDDKGKNGKATPPAPGKADA